MKCWELFGIFDTIEIKTKFPILHEFVKSFDLGKKVDVFENPSVLQVVSLIDHHKNIRGIWHPDNDNIWLWEGYNAAHFQIAALIGLPLKECGLLVIKQQQQVVVWIDKPHEIECLKSPNLIKSLSKLDWCVGQ